jgi:hypothetical protein
VLKLDAEATEWRLVEGEVIALDVVRKEYYSINRTGAVLWPLLVDGTTKEVMVERLREQFDLPAETAETDVAAFVDMLRGRGLLVES